MIERLFKLKQNGTDVKTEVIGGITTFMTMAYILAVNPSLLSASGMDATAVLIATCLASFVGTACMALMANYPFALAPGMGLNAYFAFTVCGTMGYSWQVALFAVFVEGIIFIILSLTNVREAIFNAIPSGLKKGVSAGIGLFIAFVGLQGAKIIVKSDSTLVTYVDFTADFSTQGISAVLALVGLMITAVLYVKQVKGSILIGIVSTWGLGMVCQLLGIYVPNAEAGYYSLYPTIAVTDFSAIGKTFGQCFQADFASINIKDFLVIMIAFLFVDMFDTIGTLVGVATKAEMLDEEEKLPKIKPALLADAIATCAGAIFGTSTTTTFVESASGVTEGGRTGLTTVVVGLCFLLAFIFSPLAALIPGYATAPALIVIGAMMLKTIKNIDFSDHTEVIPVFLTIIMMPLTYSIANGFGFGFVSYCILKVLSKRAKEVKPIMWVISLCFVISFILHS